MKNSADQINILPSLRIQIVLYCNEIHLVLRALENIQRAVQLARTERIFDNVEIAYGDCSPAPLFTDEQIADMGHYSRHMGIARIDYHFFNKNLGSAGGCNALFGRGLADYVLILNPDTVVSPNLLIEMMAPFKQPGVGIVEARQLPVEHPKYYDPKTGETGWAAAACVMFPREVIEAVGGFDPESFFLYCDDVDISWRVRLAGYKIIFRPSAVIFHDKRLHDDASWQVSHAEEYYAAEGALMLAHKYSRPDLVKSYREWMLAYGSDLQKKAVANFDQRTLENRLPTPISNARNVAEFNDGLFAKHRY